VRYWTTRRKNPNEVQISIDALEDLAQRYQDYLNDDEETDEEE
jgi:hypothetical protein